MKKSKFVALLLLAASFSGLSAQGFSSINEDLELLESLIADTLLNSEEQQKLLADLKKNLDESGNTITERENSLRELQARMIEMSEIYRTQSALSAKYERSSKFWRTFTMIGIPATAVLSGVSVWRIMQR